ncbi:MAG: hypothetical protein F4107_07985 [Gemmatimonadetes bacterium]|nr:hypothetical protein [Gemmatimonadota bacterium]MYD15126.1 hypothetical protein [Gemmatimonadota bacterium]MYI65859.1 hypothetical protein [Gemmatimonadota bacterium]
MRRRFDEHFFGFAGPRIVVHYDGSSNDAGTYTVLRLDLTRADKAQDAVATPLAVNPCDVDCYTPHTCGECGHKAPYVGDGAGSHHVAGGSHSFCWEGQCEYDEPSCEYKHAICIMTEDVDASLVALEDADFGELNALLDMGAGIEVLADAGILAFYDCVNRVVVSVALTETELAALAVADG